MPELLVDESVWESLAADSDAFQDTVAPQLVEDEVCVYESRLLELVGDDAADKVWYGVPECGNEVSQGGLVQLGHGHKLAALLPLGVLAFLALVFGPQTSDEWLRGLAE